MRLRVGTLNAWGLPEPLSVEPLRRLHAVGERLPDLGLDVVAFQEVWFAGARRVLAQAGKRAGLEHAWSPRASIGGSGLLVLSRHPIEEALLTPYLLRGLPERVAHGDYYGGKGYVQLRLRTPMGAVTFVDTHLHARYASEVAHAYLAHRSGQVVQLALASRDVHDPLIVAGDFNFVRGSQEHGVLRGLSGLRDLPHETGDPDATVLRSNPFRAGSRKPDRRVDYVFGRDGDGRKLTPVASRRILDGAIDGGDLAYSNHAGVEVEVEITPAPRSAWRPWQPRRDAIERAQALMLEGRRAAERRRRGQRTVTGAGLGVASLVALGDRRWLRARAGRRRFLRLGLQVGAAAALMPSVGCSLLSEVFVPDEIAAYDQLQRALARASRGAANA